MRSKCRLVYGFNRSASVSKCADWTLLKFQSNSNSNAFYKLKYSLNGTWLEKRMVDITVCRMLYAECVFFFFQRVHAEYALRMTTKTTNVAINISLHYSFSRRWLFQLQMPRYLSTCLLVLGSEMFACRFVCLRLVCFCFSSFLFQANRVFVTRHINDTHFMPNNPLRYEYLFYAQRSLPFFR